MRARSKGRTEQDDYNGMDRWTRAGQDHSWVECTAKARDRTGSAKLPWGFGLR